MERTRLTELRKIHYHLAGAAEGWDNVGIQFLPHIPALALYMYNGLCV